MKALTGRLVRKELVKPNIGILEFELDGELDFVPGQFCNLKVKVGGQPKVRPYSMTSTPGGERVEFYVKSYPDGDVASHILELEEGEGIDISGPFGSFRFQDSDKPAYMVCAGSGIAPMVSMVRYLKEEGIDKDVTFLHGASYVDELGYFEELRGLGEKGVIDYHPTISRPEENSEWGGNEGRVEGFLELCSDTDAEVYICGPPPMVENVREELLSKGFSSDLVFTERYY